MFKDNAAKMVVVVTSRGSDVHYNVENWFFYNNVLTVITKEGRYGYADFIEYRIIKRDDDIAKTLRQYQTEIADWAFGNFGPEPAMNQIVGLAEEVGELARAVLKKERGIRGSDGEWHEEIEKEIGDVAISLLMVCNSVGVNFEEMLRERWEHVKARSVNHDPINGDSK